jgi:hypothetical protein
MENDDEISEQSSDLEKLTSLLDEEFFMNVAFLTRFIHFFCEVYGKFRRELDPALHSLMRKQYPIFTTEKRPLITNLLNDICTTSGFSLMMILFKLVEEQYEGVNIRKENPNFDRLCEFYLRPPMPETIDDSERASYFWMSDSEWEEYRDSENAQMLEYFIWSERRKTEYIDLVQSLILKYYPVLSELNSDELIMYSVHLRDDYEHYKDDCEFTELFIDTGLPEEMIDLSPKGFSDELGKLSDDKKNELYELRNRRIAGECI